MHTLNLLLVVAAAACVIARTPDAEDTPDVDSVGESQWQSRNAATKLNKPGSVRSVLYGPRRRKYKNIQLSKSALARENKKLTDVPSFDQDMRRTNGEPAQSWNRKQDKEILGLENSLIDTRNSNEPELDPIIMEQNFIPYRGGNRDRKPTRHEAIKMVARTFALNPLNMYYYNLIDKMLNKDVTSETEEEDKRMALGLEPPRNTRQGPNLSRTKTLVAEDLDKLKNGFPYNEDATHTPQDLTVYKQATDPLDSIYRTVLLATVCAAITVVIGGFVFGWYSMTKKLKAAAEVEYPAYGVTGPTVDPSGDRRLAHSAHMYHYQHQKQQIMAMERSGMETRAGSVSDPESEEDNEEGDYTVYECPGLATTGNMEVQNPMFKEDAIPATPGECELVEPQPKESGMEIRTGSVSDLESGDDNEESVRTMYERPGFLTTIKVEVQNPRFKTDDVPATLNKCELLEPQLKESGMETRAGSVSDLESGEDNEDSDYTVYERPGYVTTVNEKVQNPISNSEVIPDAPDKSELVEPQPQESGMETRAGSVSDLESGEDNEESGRTEYERPGFITTDNMEVENPMFKAEATPTTPVTPGDSELVVPQAKE